MAAPSRNVSGCWVVPEVYKHHEQKKVCISRPKYREGRRAKAVKVYTINLESHYLMVQGVPAIGAMTELIQLCALYGAVEEYRPLDEYPAEEFTEVYLVKFQKLTSARAAKRHMDEKGFYGGVLHVCYVPEYESVEDIRRKLRDRRRYVIGAAQNIARGKQREDAGDKEDASTSEAVVTRRNKNSEHDARGETPHSRCPLLPPPPREFNHFGSRNPHGALPTEDRMGTLHNAVTNTKERQPAPGSSSSRASSDRDRRTSIQSSAVRFVPRTAHVENKKRKMVEAQERSLTDVTRNGEAFIGPKLPEPPKVDMEDESLNTTVSLIRSTMKQVETLPDLKPAEKKTKPRRRI
ncbi:RNA-binding protein 48 [Brachionichthys hirsutus]|uniref:RNA-binding protein 48 n=1 Tax=Brachionichthys hirsutus TaxID=412623 RepID=UPI0036048AFD